MRLFLSSTRSDLAAFRQEVLEVGKRLGVDIEAMEDFGPDPRPPLDVCKERVESCDIFVGLYAHRYGAVLPGSQGFSITQHEYRWAIERTPKLIVLPFVVDPAQLWPPGDIDVGPEREHLASFKEWLNSIHTVESLTTPEKLRNDLLRHLPRFCERVRTEREAEERRRLEKHARAVRDLRAVRRRLVRASDASSVDEAADDFWSGYDPANDEAAVAPSVSARESAALPVPPVPYVVHQYTLMETSRLVGRATELALLDTWAHPGTAESAVSSVMCFNAIGGMGKSAVTWHWFHHNAVDAMGTVAGRFWWSFYEADAGFDNFVVAALAYCAARSPAEVRGMNRTEREQELLRWLDREPFLLVLDGLERILMAYAGLDFAHMLDDDLDARTHNWSFGPDSALPDVAAPSDGTAAKHRLRQTVDARAGAFLQRLTKVKAARILVTSRLMPAALQTTTGNPVPGCTARTLHGLQPEDAVALWRKMDISGDTARLARLFQAIGHYPLLIKALAGEVAVYRPAPGDFDRWLDAHPDFDPYALLRLDQRRSHVLAYAMSGLDENGRRVLNTVAAFHSPTPFATLDALIVGTGQLTLQELDRTLAELEDRGLLGWDIPENRYDLHPVVRAVVWGGLDDVVRRAIFGELERYFSALPLSTGTGLVVDEVMPLLERFNALVGLGRHAEAADLYAERIESSGFSFESAGLHHLNVAALEALFPDGVQKPPAAARERAGAIVAHLSRGYRVSGRLHDAYELARRSMGLVPTARLSVTQSLLAELALALGKIRAADDFAHRAIADQGHPLAAHFAVQAAWCAAVAGRYTEVLPWLNVQPAHQREHRLVAQIALWSGDSAAAREAVLRAIGSSDGDVFQDLLCRVLLAEIRIELGSVEEAAGSLAEIVAEAREKALMEPELHALRCLADAHRRLGTGREGSDLIDDAAELSARAGYRLIQADVAHVRSLIESDPEQQFAAANEALHLARCDGPRYSYRHGVVRATRRINDLLDQRKS